jgi:hypothetical protein
MTFWAGFEQKWGFLDPKRAKVRDFHAASKPRFFLVWNANKSMCIEMEEGNCTLL